MNCENKTGVINSNINIKRLAINKFRATLEFHERIIDPLAARIATPPKQSKISDTCENVAVLTETLRVCSRNLEYTISIRIPPKNTEITQA